MQVNDCPKTINDVDADGNDCIRTLDKSASITNNKCTYKEGCGSGALRTIKHIRAGKGIVVGFDATTDDLNDQDPNGSQTEQKEKFVLIKKSNITPVVLAVAIGGIAFWVAHEGFKGASKGKLITVTLIGGLVGIFSGIALDRYTAAKQA